MCRYAFNFYRDVYICTTCRIGLKRFSAVGDKPDGQESVDVRCGRCGGAMRNMGPDFHVPRQRNKNQWRKVDRMITEGVTWGSCGCDGPGKRPRTFADAKRQYNGRSEPCYYQRSNRKYGVSLLNK